jgi:hypothetical protein
MIVEEQKSVMVICLHSLINESCRRRRYVDRTLFMNVKEEAAEGILIRGCRSNVQYSA